MYLSPRTERIQKLTDKLNRIGTALIEYPYTNQKDIIEDWAAFEATEKELQIQVAYNAMEWHQYLLDTAAVKMYGEQ